MFVIVFPKRTYSIINADEEFNDNLDDITLSSTQMETVNCRCHFIGAWHVVNHCKRLHYEYTRQLAIIHLNVMFSSNYNIL